MFLAKISAAEIEKVALTIVTDANSISLRRIEDVLENNWSASFDEAVKSLPKLFALMNDKEDVCAVILCDIGNSEKCFSFDGENLRSGPCSVDDKRLFGVVDAKPRLLHQIIFAFPTLGKTTLASVEPIFIDLDSAVFASDTGLDDRDAYVNMAYTMAVDHRVLLNDLVCLSRFFEEEGIVCLPDYNIDEAVNRSLSRGDDPGEGLFNDRLRNNYQQWVNDWCRDATNFGFKVVKGKNLTAILGGFYAD